MCVRFFLYQTLHTTIILIYFGHLNRIFSTSELYESIMSELDVNLFNFVVLQLCLKTISIYLGLKINIHIWPFKKLSELNYIYSIFEVGFFSILWIKFPLGNAKKVSTHLAPTNLC